MKKTYDIVAYLGEYQDKTTGETKKRRQRIGSVLTAKRENGTIRRCIKIDCIPTGAWDGWADCYEPIDEREGA